VLAGRKTSRQSRFTEYEPGSDVFGENGILTGNAHGFQTFEEALAYCEKDADEVGRHLGL